MSRCLVKDPAARATIAELLDSKFIRSARKCSDLAVLAKNLTV